MPASNESLVVSYLTKNPDEAYGIMGRLSRIQPANTGSSLLFACIRGMLEHTMAPSPGALDRMIVGMALEREQRGAITRALADAIALPAPDKDELELSIRNLILDQKSRVIRGAMMRMHDSLEGRQINEAEEAIVEAVADLAELDEEDTGGMIGAEDYDYMRHAPEELGPRVGFGLIKPDAVLKGGGRRKDFWLVNGYAKEGKSTLCRVLSNQHKIRGLNGMIFSVEDTEDEVFCSLLTNHSWRFVKNGLHYDDVENRGRRLNDQKQRALMQAVEDFQTNPAYGNLEIVDVREDASILNIHQQMIQKRRQWGRLDYVIIDYLQNLDPVDPKKRDYRLQVGQTMRVARGISKNFHHGEGVFLVSPHPVKQEAYDKACQKKYYTFTALRETAEAGAKLTASIWILIPPDMREHNKAKIGISAQRKGGTGPIEGWPITAILDRCYFATEASRQDEEGMKELDGSQHDPSETY